MPQLSRAFHCSLIGPLAAALLGCASITARSPTPATQTISVEEAAMNDWLTVYNKDNVEAFERFASARYSEKELAERNAADIANGARAWFYNYGVMKVAGAPVITPGQAEVKIRAEGVDACFVLYVEVDGAARDKIGGVYLSPFVEADCGEERATVRNLDDFAVQTRDYADDLEKAGRFSGVVLISRGGQPVVSSAHGLARIKGAVSNTLETRFELASVSKLFTTVAVARLVQQGRLTFDTPISEVLPNFPGGADHRRITVRQLLSHTSGLSDYYRNGAIFAENKPRPRLEDYWSLFESHPLANEPGAKYDYSNSNYVVLGSMIEAIAGQPFAEFVQTEVFDRAGMESSCYCAPGPTVSAQPRSKHTALAGRARKALRDGWIEVPDDWPRAAAPAGFSMSTAADLTLFASAILDRKLVDDAVLTQMLQRDVVMDDGGYSGLGFEIYRTGDDYLFGHGGFSWGVRTQVDIYPDSDIVVVILSNSETSGTEALKYKTRKWLGSLLEAK